MEKAGLSKVVLHAILCYKSNTRLRYQICSKWGVVSKGFFKGACYLK